MAAENVTPVLPVADLGAAVEFWSSVLGVEPTFVDDDRWAQFDLGPRRLALAGTDRLTDEPCVMVKVHDLEGTRRQLGAGGHSAEEIETGAHERRFLARTDFGTIIFYSPLAESVLRA
jgi:catechol 2,3-dioxygenase-like lactoylglutathione lyase family enzyme